MAFKSQKNFTATLDDTNVFELSKRLDRDKDKYDDRLDVINNIVNDTEFFTEYFSKYFPVNLNASDYLSLENNVCLLLEQYASYLLNSSDIKEEKDYQYKFYYDENEFRKSLGKESLYDGNDTVTIDYLLSNQQNYKKTKEQKITRQDLKRDDWCGSVLRDYQSLIDHLNQSNLPLYTRNRIKGEVQRDMVLAKDRMLEVFGYNLRFFDESTVPDLNEIDFTNPKHLKGYTFSELHTAYSKVDGLLHMRFNGDFQNDFQCILYDVDQLVLKTKLTDRQSDCLNRYRRGQEITSIADDLGIKHNTVSETINRAIDKVCKTAFELSYSTE